MEEKITVDDLAINLRQARKKGYAGGGEYKERSVGDKVFRDSSRTGYLYEDQYRSLITPGSYAGEEFQSYKDHPVWRMIYSGGMIFPYYNDPLLAKKVTEFLRKCLWEELKIDRNPRFDFHPRGPARLERHYGSPKRKAFLYRCLGEFKDIRSFWGYEEIYVQRNIIFRGTFTGGTVNESISMD